jgi:nucleotide-binding universal stress UspA family protein
MQSIVVGYDGSDASRRALGRAADLADEGAKVVVVHAAASVYPGSSSVQVPDPAEERQSSALLDEAKELLAKRGVSPETRTTVGGAADALVDVATEAGADVVIVGRRSSAVAHILGSVSSDVVERAPCDVLVVH